MVLQIVIPNKSPNASEKVGYNDYLNQKSHHAHDDLVLLLREAHKEKLEDVILKVAEIFVEFDKLQIPERN